MVKQVKRNRRRGKEVEKRVASMLDGLRIGVLGREDVLTDRFSVEVKSRKKLAFISWYNQAKKNAKKGKIPLLVCHLYNSSQYYAVLALQDFINLIKETE